MAAFERYIRRPDAAPGQDPLGYRQFALWLTNEEAASLFDDLRGVLQRYEAHEATPDRRRIRLSITAIPEDH